MPPKRSHRAGVTEPVSPKCLHCVRTETRVRTEGRGPLDGWLEPTPLERPPGCTVARLPGCPGEWFALTRGAVIACYGKAVNPIASAMAADRPLACDAPALPLRQ